MIDSVGLIRGEVRLGRPPAHGVDEGRVGRGREIEEIVEHRVLSTAHVVGGPIGEIHVRGNAEEHLDVEHGLQTGPVVAAIRHGAGAGELGDGLLGNAAQLLVRGEIGGVVALCGGVDLEYGAGSERGGDGEIGRAVVQLLEGGHVEIRSGRPCRGDVELRTAMRARLKILGPRGEPFDEIDVGKKLCGDDQRSASVDFGGRVGGDLAMVEITLGLEDLLHLPDSGESLDPHLVSRNLGNGEIETIQQGF